MAIWGMGANFSIKDNQLDNFIRENFVCIGWSEQEQPKYYELMKKIKIGDIIYIKSFYITTNPMKIKAIGVVTDTFKNSNSHQGYENCDNEVKIKWLNTDLNEELPVNDKYKERKSSIFKEDNEEIAKRIIALI